MVLVVVLGRHPTRHHRTQSRRQHRPVEHLPHVPNSFSELRLS
jgi:hypothetical protein